MQRTKFTFLDTDIESGTGNQTRMMEIAGYVSHRILARYSRIPMHAERDAQAEMERRRNDCSPVSHEWQMLVRARRHGTPKALAGNDKRRFP